MNSTLKKKLAVTGVGVVALAVLYFMGPEVNFSDAAQVLFSGDISTFCQQVEDMNIGQ